MKLFKCKDFLIKGFKNHFGSIASGVLIGTSYIPFLPWALLFCLVPLWLECLRHQEGFWKCFFRGWITQFILSLIGFYWIAFVSHEYGFMPWPAALAVLLLFTSTVHIYIALAVAIATWLRGHLGLSPLATLILMAGLTSLGEMWWPSLFPWNFAYPLLWVNSAIAQTADVFGFFGLSLLILLTNAGLAWVVLETNRGKIAAMLTCILLTFGILHFWGVEKRKAWQATDSHLKVLQVQANIGNEQKFLAERGQGSPQLILDQYFQMTREGVKKNPDVDLILWPESAFPDYLDPSDFLRPFPAQFAALLSEIQKPIMTGGYSKEYVPGNPGHAAKMKSYNAVFIYGPDLHPFGPPYHKTDLLVFGEYTPMTDTFPWLATISPAGEGFSRGHGPQIQPFGDIKIGPQVCYESLYPEFSAESARLGADIFINVTNDSWFGPTFEPYQHMIMTLARGVEMRRPLVRDTNTGITTAILADGTQLQRSPWYTPWFFAYDIPFKKNAELTFYAKYGAWLPWLLLLSLVAVTITGTTLRRSRARS